jgi:hypothetical protein
MTRKGFISRYLPILDRQSRRSSPQPSRQPSPQPAQPSLQPSQEPSKDSEASSLSLKGLFDEALQAYKSQTGKDLTTSPLFVDLQRSDISVNQVITVLKEQAQVPTPKLMKHLQPTVEVLCSVNDVLGSGIGLVSHSGYVF